MGESNGSPPYGGGTGIPFRKEPGDFTNRSWIAEIFAPQPPLKWVCKPLTLAHGRPNVFYGNGGSGKSFFAQDMILRSVTGTLLLGRFEVPRLRWLLADWEQGKRNACQHFQDLLGGMGLSPSCIGFRDFAYDNRPIASLSPTQVSGRRDTDIISDLCKRMDGFDAAFIDSVRASSRGAEENSGDASVPFDLANEAGEKVGCSVNFIDHASPKGGTGLQRGHTSKQDASQSGLSFVRPDGKGKPTTVTCRRYQTVAEEDVPDPFSFRIEKCYGGCRIVEAISFEPEGAEEMPLLDRLYNLIVERPGFWLNETIAKEVRKRPEDVNVTLRSLEIAKRIARLGGGKSPWVPVDLNPDKDFP